MPSVVETSAGVVNAMSVDVEDYFQVSAFEGNVSRGDWDRLPARVEGNTDRVLSLMERHGVKITFFTLGWVAERFPGVVRRIADAGHEVASHGYSHMRIHQQSREEFREDVSRAKKILEDITGTPVLGYRAPSYSIGRDTLWAADELEGAGYLYSSSIYPIYHDLYGMPEAPRFPFRHRGGDGILEIPISTARLFRFNWPSGGGGYFRLLPYRLFRSAIRHINERESKPCIFYFHPWELDPEQPRPRNLSAKTRFRHYLNLDRMEARISRLLDDFRWSRVDRVFLDEGNGFPRG
jgi:polysaccharide deacetylase family protein (PEP-CTERM system associated)